MLKKVERFVERHAMIAPGDRIAVAVSGGADSVALLHVLREVYPQHKFDLVHLNHCLRANESDADEEFVRELADQLGLRIFAERQDVGLLAATRGDNLESVARDCRYQFFAALMKSQKYDKIATGHTRSDQAETVLFRLLRGAAGAALSAVRPVRDGSIIRPMLDVSRDEVTKFLEARKISWREDSSNCDQSFSRNRIRHQLLPELRAEWNPNIEQSLANTADWYLEEQRFWDSRVEDLKNACVTRSGTIQEIDVTAAALLLPAEQRRLIAAVLAGVSANTGAIGFAHIESARRLIQSDSGTGGVDLPGVRLERSFDALRFSRSGRAASGFDVQLLVPGQTALPGSSAGRVETCVCDSREIEERYNTRDWAFLDWDRVPKPLRLRNWHPGDRYRPVGRASEKKLKHLFQEKRIHSWKRARWPIITSSDGGERNEVIIWARAFGAAAEFAAGPSSRNLLSIHEFSSAYEEGGIEPSP